MAKFSKKTWVDRVSEQPQRRLLTPTDGGTAMTVDVTRQEGIVAQEGDAFSAANMNGLETRIKTAIDANDSAITSVTQKANTNQTNINTLSSTVTTLNNSVTAVNNRVTTVNNSLTAVANRVTTVEGELTANGKRIYMDYKNGKYGYNTSANRGADTFHPFSDYSSVGLGMAVMQLPGWGLPSSATQNLPAGTYNIGIACDANGPSVYAHDNTHNVDLFYAHAPSDDPDGDWGTMGSFTLSSDASVTLSVGGTHFYCCAAIWK